MPSLISDVKELKKCKDRVDRFKKERPKMAKLIGLGKKNLSMKELMKAASIMRFIREKPKEARSKRYKIGKR